MCDASLARPAWLDAGAQVACPGMRLAWGTAEPTERPEATHREIEVAIPFGDAAVEIDYQSAGGRRLHASVAAHHVSIIPAGQPHAVHWQRSAELLVLFLAPERIDEAAQSLGIEYRPQILERYAALDPLIRQLGLSLVADCRRERAPQRLYLDAVACVLASHLVRQYSQAPQRSPSASGLPQHLLKRSVEFIHANLAKNLALDDIAQTVGLSPYHFSRLFKRATGLGPHGYLMGCRVERAKELLRTSGRAISDVALDSGFADQSHMTGVFRKRTGTTPKMFRQQSLS